MEDEDDDIDVVTIPETGKPRSREDIEESSAKAMRSLFDDPEPDAPIPDEEEPEEPEEPEEEEEEETEEKDGDPDVDYDAEDEPEKDDDDDDDEEAEPPVKETKARIDAKENGRKAKEFKAQLVEKDLEVVRLKDQLTEATTRLEDFNKVTVDPRTTPEYQELNGAMWADVDAAVAEELPESASGLADRFAPYMKSYLVAAGKAGPERLQAIKELKASIVSELGGFPKDQEDWDDDDLVAADSLAKDVLSVIRRNADKAKDMIKLEAELRNKAKAGRISIGVREYERLESEVLPLLKAIGKMDDKLVEENPYHPEAVITQLVKGNPKLAAKLESAVKDATELVLGLRPLTDKEYDYLEEQGVDIKDHLKERKRLFDEKKRKLLPLMARGLFTANITKKALEALIKEQRAKKDTEDEIDALGDIDRKRRKAPKASGKPAKEEVSARERPSAVSKLWD